MQANRLTKALSIRMVNVFQKIIRITWAGYICSSKSIGKYYKNNQKIVKLIRSC